jgi:hypothetical protein
LQALYSQIGSESMSSITLQRLRQGNGRCQQQLLSLLQWHQQQPQPYEAPAPWQQHHRGFADKPDPKQFQKQRKRFDGSLSELRKQWASRLREQQAAAAAAEAAARCGAAAAAAVAYLSAAVGPPLDSGVSPQATKLVLLPAPCS